MTALSLAVAAALAALTGDLAAQQTAPCAPVATATCDPMGNPISPGNPGGGAPGAPAATAVTVNAVTATVPLGGGLDARGAEGVALDPATGRVYIGINGAIISGCEGDPLRGGPPLPQYAGAHQISIVDPALAREVATARTGMAPIWPTVDPVRNVVYMAGSGDGTMTVHSLVDGSRLNTISVGGRPHAGGLDFSTGQMLVGNTVRSSDVIAEQNHASIVDAASGRVVRDFETSPAPHGVAVDQERDLIYYTAVGDGAIVVVNAATGAVITSGVPKARYGADFGGNNMLARQAATRRLFQVNSQRAALGVLVVDEVTLEAEQVINVANSNVWGMWVDEPNRLLFATVPTSNIIGVIDLDSLSHVASIPVGACPYAVVVDPERRIGLSSNQGTPTEQTTASIFDLCPVYAAVGRTVAGCGAPATLTRRPQFTPLTIPAIR